MRYRSSGVKIPRVLLIVDVMVDACIHSLSGPMMRRKLIEWIQGRRTVGKLDSGSFGKVRVSMRGTPPPHSSLSEHRHSDNDGDDVQYNDVNVII